MFKAEIVADSLSPQGDRLTSLLITFPRIILAEINTHRMLSKNTSSSRAIPFKAMVKAVSTNPFVPIAFQKEHSGMQGTEYLTDELEIQTAKDIWYKALDNAIREANMLTEHKVTKQLANRVLEPFMWTTMLITGSKEGWDNFFHLRCPDYQFDVEYSNETVIQSYKSRKEALEDGLGTLTDLDEMGWLKANKGQAEIHMMKIAEMIYDAMQESTPEQLAPGEYHIPFKKQIPATEVWKLMNLPVDASSTMETEEFRKVQIKISTAMAARTSYTKVGDEAKVDYENMVALHDRLLVQEPPHSSPMEHIGKAMTDGDYLTNIKGELKLDDVIVSDNIKLAFLQMEKSESSAGWCRNFRGFFPYRHIIETTKK